MQSRARPAVQRCYAKCFHLNAALVGIKHVDRQLVVAVEVVCDRKRDPVRPICGFQNQQLVARVHKALDVAQLDLSGAGQDSSHSLYTGASADRVNISHRWPCSAMLRV